MCLFKKDPIVIKDEVFIHLAEAYRRKKYSNETVKWFYYDNHPINTLISRRLEREYKKEMEKEIIGYKCPTKLFDFAVEKGTIFKKNNEHSVYYCEGREVPFYGLPSEIVETWEPVYREENIKIGEYEVYFHIFKELDDSYITINKIDYSYFDLDNLLGLIKKGQIQSLNVGCQGQYKVDKELLQKIINKLSK